MSISDLELGSLITDEAEKVCRLTKAYTPRLLLPTVTFVSGYGAYNTISFGSISFAVDWKTALHNLGADMRRSGEEISAVIFNGAGFMSFDECDTDKAIDHYPNKYFYVIISGAAIGSTSAYSVAFSAVCSHDGIRISSKPRSLLHMSNYVVDAFKNGYENAH